MLVNLNLYDIDIQTIVSNISSLSELKKISFKRSTFMDKIKFLERLLVDADVPKLTEFNLNMTNVLAQLMNPTDFFIAIEKNKTIKKLHIAALSQDNDDAKKMRMLIRAVKNNTVIRMLNISENYLTAACFHIFRDVFLK